MPDRADESSELTVAVERLQILFPDLSCRPPTVLLQDTAAGFPLGPKRAWEWVQNRRASLPQANFGNDITSAIFQVTGSGSLLSSTCAREVSTAGHKHQKRDL